MQRQNNRKQKFETNWLEKSIESLEKNAWGPAPADEGYLLQTCYALRKKQLKSFTTEDLRIMIGQDIGLRYLIPLAIQVLESDILAEGDFYEGDLLQFVLLSDREYWLGETENWKVVCELFRRNEERLRTFDTTKEIRNAWFTAFRAFEQIHGADERDRVRPAGEKK